MKPAIKRVGSPSPSNTALSENAEIAETPPMTGTTSEAFELFNDSYKKNIDAAKLTAAQRDKRTVHDDGNVTPNGIAPKAKSERKLT